MTLSPAHQPWKLHVETGLDRIGFPVEFRIKQLPHVRLPRPRRAFAAGEAGAKFNHYLSHGVSFSDGSRCVKEGRR